MAQKAFQIAFDGMPVEQDFYGDIMSLQVEECTSVARHVPAAAGDKAR